MASPLDILTKKDKVLFLPKKIDLAINLIQSFIKNNNPLGLKIIIILAGARENIVYDKQNRVKFNVDELCSICKINRRYLNNNLKKLLSTFHQFIDEDGSSVGTYPIHTYRYALNNQYLYLTISEEAKQLLNNLKNKKDSAGYQFTNAISKNLIELDLKQVHKHTLKFQMLLEMINNYSTTKRKYLSLDEINGYFGTNYKRYGEIERKILSKIKLDIDKYSTISFIYKPKDDYHQGTGRPKIVGVFIDVIDNQKI